MQKILAAEHGGMNEVFAGLYAVTGDMSVVSKLSRRFHHRAILNPLARGEGNLPGKHANSQIPKLIGLATRCELSGDLNDRAGGGSLLGSRRASSELRRGRALRRGTFWPAGQTLKTGFRLRPPKKCNVYNKFKLTKHIFGWTTGADAAEFYERALLNHIRSRQDSRRSRDL